MKNLFRRMNERLARLGYGRYGNDELGFVLSLLALALILLSYVPLPYFGIVLPILSFFVLGYSLFRSFSKNIPRRRRELECYYRIKNAPRRARELRKNKRRDKKTHLYFKCPACRAVLRVPRGKGSITVTCPRCARKTNKKT